MEGNKRYLCVTNPLMGQQSTAKPKANVVGCILRSISAYEEGMRELALTKTAVLAKMDERSNSLEELFSTGLQETYYCPFCGSKRITINDAMGDTEIGKCSTCGKAFRVVEIQI